MVALDVGLVGQPLDHLVEDAAACDPMLGGWYYDDNAAPKNIILCPVSCERVSSAPQGNEVDLLFGCKTMYIPG
ncbi:MAG: hypothetical protein JNL82_34705 [Myxococcales bacterium]|nr:hypothetical protein [Myxococcales bacterium]